MKITWFIPVNHRNYNNMPASVWIRCLQLIPFLEKHGITNYINDASQDADISIFVRWQGQQAYDLAVAQKKRGQRIIFDLCVNFFDETGLFAGGYGTIPERVTETHKMIEIADVVTCASHFIAERASNFHPWAEYISDSINREYFKYTKPKKDFYRRRLNAIYCGTAAKASELAPLLPLLKRHKIKLITLTEKRPDFERYYKFANLRYPIRFIKWKYETFPENILKGDICLSYRSFNNPYNRGHSLFKIGVFMTQGIPAIASPIPSYTEIIENEHCGYLCDSLEEWATVLERLVKNREMIEKFSIESSSRMQPYFTESIIVKYIQLFRKISEL